MSGLGLSGSRRCAHPRDRASYVSCPHTSPWSSSCNEPCLVCPLLFRSPVFHVVRLVICHLLGSGVTTCGVHPKGKQAATECPQDCVRSTRIPLIGRTFGQHVRVGKAIYHCKHLITSPCHRHKMRTEIARQSISDSGRLRAAQHGHNLPSRGSSVGCGRLPIAAASHHPLPTAAGSSRPSRSRSAALTLWSTCQW